MKKKENKNKKSLVYQLITFKYAWQGLHYFFQKELKALIHLIAAILAITLGISLKISISEWIFVAFAIGIVFVTEITNTAFELLVDIIKPEQSRKAGITKDLAAAAVMVASVVALVIGLGVFLPKLLTVFKFG